MEWKRLLTYLQAIICQDVIDYAVNELNASPVFAITLILEFYGMRIEEYCLLEIHALIDYSKNNSNLFCFIKLKNNSSMDKYYEIIIDTRWHFKLFR